MLKKKTWQIGTLIILVLFLFSVLDLGALADTTIVYNPSSSWTTEEALELEDPLEPGGLPPEKEQPPKHDVSQAAPEEEQETINPIEKPDQENDSKIAYLTFDDGPTQNTDLIINVLNEYQAKATFFMLEPQMESNALTIQRMKDEGHALGLHGVTHDRHQFYLSVESVLIEMNTAQAKLRELIGLEIFLIRTPYGSKPYLNPEQIEATQEAGYKIWDWNVDSRDWYYKDSRLVSETIKQIKTLEQREIEPVILFHDRKETLDLLPEVLEYLIDNGYTLAVLEADMEPVRLN